jgi:hypothetical protein
VAGQTALTIDDRKAAPGFAFTDANGTQIDLSRHRSIRPSLREKHWPASGFHHAAGAVMKAVTNASLVVLVPPAVADAAAVRR